jgi:hypothetical protein
MFADVCEGAMLCMISSKCGGDGPALYTSLLMYTAFQTSVLMYSA